MLDKQSLIEFFEKILSADRILSDADSLLTYGKDWLNDFAANPSLILLPETVAEVQAIVLCCNQAGIAIIPSGGRTGLSGGATACNGEVVVSLSRMNKILEVNRTERTLRCQAGVVTEKIQLRATEEGLYFPIDFASKGSSQIGGNIATNAGGIRVIRYGMLREWVLGLTVVTGKGEILNLNGSLVKNQSGLDLRQLLIGSEGILGIIVEATLALTNPPGEFLRVLCGLNQAGNLVKLLELTRDQFPVVNVFEFFDRKSLDKVVEHHKLPPPLSSNFSHYALIEVEGEPTNLQERVERFLTNAAEDGLIDDAVISQNLKQAHELLRYRELISETLSSMHVLHKNDISVPPSAIPAFIEEFTRTLQATYPNFEAVVFGHIGDGNLHISILKPDLLERTEFFSQCHEADQILFAVVKKYCGSISAEHGVGLLKRDFLHFTRSPEEIALMRGIKSVFDPNGILNPGKVFN